MRGETAIGLVRHPYTQCYQVWVSATGADVILVSARHHRSDAEADVQAVKAVLGSQDYYDIEKVATLLNRLRNASDEEPQPLPPDLIKRICRAILTP